MLTKIATDRAVRVHDEVVYFRADLDDTELEALAYRAALSKSQRAKQGPVVVRVTRREAARAK